MIRISQIKVPVNYNQELLEKKISKLIKSNNFKYVRIVKKSIDARNKDELMYILTVDIEISDEKQFLKKNVNNKNIMLSKDIQYCFPKNLSYEELDKLIKYDNASFYKRPIIIGAGPAGYFCGLYLARNGYKPIIIERGKAVEERTKDVDNFWNGGKLNRNSNVSFGEGGAGTFSDGKLNTGIKDKNGRIEAVIKDFISFGANEEIGYINKPHVGTDVLKTVMKNMREEIISAGGDIFFNTVFTEYKTKKDDCGDIVIVKLHNLIEDIDYELESRALVLAIGHSSRDTFSMLNENNLPMEPKAFAIGVRIEHPRELINASQYGTSEAAKLLPTADYKMTYHSTNGRSVYSFCMCPGGYVVNASSDDNQSVVNGMSYHDRDADNSNSAIVVNVTPEDFTKEGFDKYGVLAGVHFQEKYEKKSYDIGNGVIPVQLFMDYKLKRKSEDFGVVKPCIKGNYTFADLNNCLPEYVNDAIIEGISYYDSKLKGFAMEDAVLSGIESRTSSPVRINRDENYMSAVTGIFPCGEGAGYAGGITSAAVDGIKVAEAVAAYINEIRKALL